jgi:hypothetical protein
MHLLKYVAIGLLAVALAAGIFYWSSLGSQVRLDGKIVKVRTLSTGDASSLMILEVRLNNPARTPFMIQDVQIEVAPLSGAPMIGMPTNQADLDRVLDYYKTAGPRFNTVLKTRDRIPGGAAGDWTVAAGFDLPESAIMNRRSLVVRFIDVDGPVAEIR